ncbi:class I adenylate-forming enzyme family protein [Rhodococcus maanshanensis]|uniref:Feruloyl-CoA synthase n=1 Tax=Rhodococcus maanshanensis TaxID=183556 RepID=A0A1H7U0T8_9NOCA|nr:AMP-binding protein [Rhodococcus maanshanensis]SEL90680.1 feruloyl-CoA synthase [Rhodococcus maanshanensis]
MDLTTMLESTCRKFPDKEAVVYGAERLSYRELVAASKRAAEVLRGRGVRRGDRVAVMTYNTPGFVIAAFGAWRAGAVLVPVNHKLAPPEVEYTLTHCGAKVGVVSAGLRANAEAGAPQVDWLLTELGDDAEGNADRDFDALVDVADEWAGVEVEETEIAQVLYTSGTTSAPKGCLHTHRSITTVAPYIATTLGLDRDERVLIAMPIWHAAPLNVWFVPTMFLGGTVVLMREYAPLPFLEIIGAEKITAFFGAPIAYLAPLQVVRAAGIDMSTYDFSTMRRWTYGGAPIGAEVARQLQDAYRSEDFYQVYGMSEMGPTGTALYPHEQIAKAGSIGRGGMPGVDLRVVRPDGLDAGPGETGEIWLASDTRMVGYLDNDEATAEVFEGRWYRSGDVARVDEDGYLYIVDRTKDVIITGGENVYSQEVEEAIRPRADIVDVAVIGRPHPQWGETVVAVVATVGGATLELDELREYLADKLARYKIPRELVVVDELPRNPSGKLTKHVIREAVLS